MLVAFALRALIPPGFMPANARPFSLEICWEGLPAHMLGHGEPAQADGMDSMGMGSMAMDEPAEDSTSHRDPAQGARTHHPAHGDHCVFGTACSAGPVSHFPLLSQISSAQQLRAVAFDSIEGAVRFVHLPQPRAPPGRLS